jgi:hypothetical protein
MVWQVLASVDINMARAMVLFRQVQAGVVIMARAGDLFTAVVFLDMARVGVRLVQEVLDIMLGHFFMGGCGL